MRKVKVSRRVYEGQGKYRNEAFDAVFHAWGCLYEEFEAGPGNYSVAIVERSNGQVETVLPGEIQFVPHQAISATLASQIIGGRDPEELSTLTAEADHLRETHRIASEIGGVIEDLIRMNSLGELK